MTLRSGDAIVTVKSIGRGLFYVNGDGSGGVLPEPLMSLAPLSYNDARFSHDNTMFALASTGSSNNLYIFNTDNWSYVVFTPETAVRSFAFSNDDSKLAVGCSANIHIYDTTSWLIIQTIPFGTSTQYCTKIEWSGDDSKLACIVTVAPYVHVYDTATWTIPVAFPTMDYAAYIKDIDLNSDGSEMIFCRTNGSYTGLKKYDTATMTPSASQPPITIYDKIEQCAYSPDYSKYSYIDYNYSDLLRVVNTVDDTLHSSYQSVYNYLAWSGNNIIYIADTVSNNIMRKINITTGEITIPTDNATGTGTIIAPVYENGDKWEVNGTIVESLLETEWVCTAYNYHSGAVAGKVTTTGSTFTIPVLTPEPVMVTVQPRIIDVWRPNKTRTIGDKVFPTDPNTKPYYFECTTSGISGSTEPNWNVGNASTTPDGTAVWTNQELIPQPVSHAPLIPTIA